VSYISLKKCYIYIYIKHRIWLEINLIWRNYKMFPSYSPIKYDLLFIFCKNSLVKKKCFISFDGLGLSAVCAVV